MYVGTLQEWVTFFEMFGSEKDVYIRVGYTLPTYWNMMRTHGREWWEAIRESAFAEILNGDNDRALRDLETSIGEMEKGMGDGYLGGRARCAGVWIVWTAAVNKMMSVAAVKVDSFSGLQRTWRRQEAERVTLFRSDEVSELRE